VTQGRGAKIVSLNRVVCERFFLHLQKALIAAEKFDANIQ
jgi:hypothetical protein